MLGQMPKTLLDRPNTGWSMRVSTAIFTDLEYGSIKVGILAFALRHHDRQRTSAAGIAGDDDRAMQCEGGLLGRPLELVIMESPRSDVVAVWRSSAGVTLRCRRTGVAAIFGCNTWSSASRARRCCFDRRARARTASYSTPASMKARSLAEYLFHGATPHQQGLPRHQFPDQQRVRRIFLIGSDYVYPRTT